MKYQPLTQDDILPWADLLSASFGRSPADMGRLLRWFHPSGMLAWGAWDGNQLAAQYSCLLRQLRVPWSDDSLLVGMSVNMAVHPDYRGQGLVKHVSRPVYEALRGMGGVAGVGFSNAEGVKVDKRSKGYGYQVVGRMRSHWIWLRRGAATLVLSAAEAAVPLTLTTHFPDTPFNWHDTQTYPASIRFDTNWESVRFRFARHPFRRYRFGVWQENGQILGIVIYRPMQINRFAGASLLAAYANDLPELLRRWVFSVRQEGVTLVHLLTTPQSSLLSAMKPLGIRIANPLPRAPYYLTLKPLMPDLLPHLERFSAWDCSGGDIL